MPWLPLRLAVTGRDANVQGGRVAAAGLAVNITLALIKLVGGVVGNSYALIADAAESLTDILGSLIVVGGLRIAAIPPDENHPYGHGKAEALAAVAVSALLLAAAVGIAIAAVRELLTPHAPPAAWTLLVLLGVVATKETLFQIARASAKRSGSSAVLADAWHHRSDAITSVAAGLGIAAAYFGGPAWVWADEAAAILAAGLIMWNACMMMRGPLQELLDAAPTGMVDEVRRVAEGVEGVIAVEKVMARKSGQMYHVDMHLHVSGDLSLHAAHAAGGRVKAAIKAAMPSVRDVMMHVEPAQPAESRGPARAVGQP